MTHRLDPIVKPRTLFGYLNALYHTMYIRCLDLYWPGYFDITALTIRHQLHRTRAYDLDLLGRPFCCGPRILNVFLSVD
jgi:hypothetical protein